MLSLNCLLLWTENEKDRQVLTSSNPDLAPQISTSFSTFIIAANTGFTILLFQEKIKIVPVLALGKGKSFRSFFPSFAYSFFTYYWLDTVQC